MIPSHVPDAQHVAAEFNAFLPDCDLALVQSFFLIPLPVPLYLIGSLYYLQFFIENIQYFFIFGFVFHFRECN